MRCYIRRFAVAPGTQAAVVVADPQEQEDTVAALHSAGIRIAAGLEPGAQLLGTRGNLHLTGLTWRDALGRRHRTACDVIAMSAGWMPTAHLAAQMGAKLRFDPATQSLLPQEADGPLHPIGIARDVLVLVDCLSDGKAATHQALAELEMHKFLNLPRRPLSTYRHPACSGQHTNDPGQNLPELPQTSRGLISSSFIQCSTILPPATR